MTRSVEVSAACPAHPGAPHPSCPVCNPHKTVPELNRAGRPEKPHDVPSTQPLTPAERKELARYIRQDANGRLDVGNFPRMQNLITRADVEEDEKKGRPT